MSKPTGYELSQRWHEFTYQVDDNKPIHGSLIFMILELHNKLFGKEVFGLPTDDVMESIGIKNKATYYSAIKYLQKNDFIEVLQLSKNRFTSTKIKLGEAFYRIKIVTATVTAIDTATVTATVPISNTNVLQTNTPTKPVEVVSDSNESEPPKKSASKKVPPKRVPAKKKKETDPLHAKLVERFHDFHLEHKKRKFQWGKGKEFKQFEFFIVKFRATCQEHDVSEVDMPEQFEAIFLHGCKKIGGYYWDSLSPTLFNSKYNEILSKVNTHNNGQASNILQHALDTVDRMYPKEQPTARTGT